MHKSFTADAGNAASVYLFTTASFEKLKKDPFPGARAIAKGQGFTGGAGQMVLVPGEDGQVAHVLFGLGNGEDSKASVARAIILHRRRASRGRHEGPARD